MSRRRTAAFWTLVVVTVLVSTPLIGALIGGAVATAFDCPIEVGRAYPCTVAGYNLGTFVYATITVGSILDLGLRPAMAVMALAWVGFSAWAAARRTRSHRSAAR
jgi:hypothetical protein